MLIEIKEIKRKSDKKYKIYGVETIALQRFVLHKNLY